MLLYYAFILLGGVLIFLALGHIIYQKRSSVSMISWILFILFVPHVAAPLYFVIGIRKRNSQQHKNYLTFSHVNLREDYRLGDTEHAIANILENSGLPPATKANRFELITDDTEAYARLIEAVNAATERIEIATYVFAFDPMTEELLHHLTQKAHEGVTVRLLLDLVGSFRASLQHKRFAPLRAAGGEVVFFTPILRHPFQNYINLRNHRKIYLFDRQKLFSGGMNLTNEYLGRADGTRRWKDLLYCLQGPAVEYFAAIFCSDWAYATGKPLAYVSPKRTEKLTGKSWVQVVPSGPDIPKDALYEALLNAIYSAKERIWIVTPYFVPDENTSQALLIARDKGVDVKLITPKTSNHYIADLVRSSYMRELEEAGADVVLYTGEMLHGKAILIDHFGGMVGSLNLDNRSLFLNYEVVTFVYSPAFIEHLEQWMETLMNHSTRELPRVGKTREAMENIMKVLAPLV